MARMRRVRLLALTAVAGLSGGFARGDCINSASCMAPCPAELGCYFDGECASGVCISWPDWPTCSPSYCACVNGSWTCTADCAGTCAPGPGDTDADGVGDASDNCLWTPNGAQDDADSDGTGNVCDCAPLDPTAGRPPALTVVRADGLGGGATWFAWLPVPSADRYEILRGEIGVPGSAVDWTAHDADPTDAYFVEGAIPPPAEGWFYLFRGVDLACGGSGP